MKQAIQKWNIWWENSAHLDDYIGISRKQLPFLLKMLHTKHIKDIIGVRRCGKTILMYQIIHNLIKTGTDPKNILYLNFDDPEFIDLDKTISNACEICPDITHLFLDEIQNIPQWERKIRSYYDRQEFQHIFVSGSSASLISRDVGKTLTGRHLTNIIMPFSFEEFLLFHNVNYKEHISQKEKILHYLEMFLKEGGFPETINKESLLRKTILVDLYNDILSRDIVSRFEADPVIVKKIGYYMMTNISAPFSYNSIANALDLHYDTVKKYLPYFQEVFLLYIIPFFSWKVKVQLKKDMKCYSIDNGLRNAVSFTFSEDLGRLAENSVFIELKRRNKDIYFWKDKKEVDFVIKEGNTLKAINVTYTNKIPKREKEGLLEFREMYSNAQLMLITKDLEEVDKNNIHYIPLWKWLLEEEKN